MRRILLIEDDQFKRDAINKVIASELSSTKIVEAHSVHAAVAEISAGTFDLLVLDMALPSHSVVAGESPATSMLSGGLEVVMELAYLSRRDPIVVLTQYPELEIEGELLAIPEAEERLRSMFGEPIRAVIHYEDQDSGWVTRLQDLLRGM